MEPMNSIRPTKSKKYPWYDSVWLTRYTQAQEIIRMVRPDMLKDFVDAFRIFHTRADFVTTLLEQPFDADTLRDIKRIAESLRPTELELHEARTLGRFVVHDNPFFTELQQRILPLVSDVAGEPVEGNYNFLSLYTPKGICPVHLDAPEAKWTLDLCLDQTTPWPIFFSQVKPWPGPESEQEWSGEDWENKIKQCPSLNFKSHALKPGQAILFSGSSQWHYREHMPKAPGQPFCKLLFFHFIPKGAKDLLRPKNWAQLFGIPELSQVL